MENMKHLGTGDADNARANSTKLDLWDLNMVKIQGRQGFRRSTYAYDGISPAGRKSIRRQTVSNKKTPQTSAVATSAVKEDASPEKVADVEIFDKDKTNSPSEQVNIDIVKE